MPANTKVADFVSSGAVSAVDFQKLKTFAEKLTCDHALAVNAVISSKPGCAASYLAKQVADEAGVFFYALNVCAETSLAQVEEAFARARAEKHAVVCVDSIDYLENADVLKKLTDEMNSSDNAGSVAVIVRTNRPQVDEAISQACQLHIEVGQVKAADWL